MKAHTTFSKNLSFCLLLALLHGSDLLGQTPVAVGSTTVTPPDSGAVTEGGPPAEGESKGSDQGDKGDKGEKGRGRRGDGPGRGREKPPVSEGRGHRAKMDAQKDLNQAARSMTPDRLHDAQAIMNLNRATMKKTLSDMLFERDINSGKYDNEKQQELRQQQTQEAMATLKTLSEALPETRELLDSSTPEENGNDGRSTVGVAEEDTILPSDTTQAVSEPVEVSVQISEERSPVDPGAVTASDQVVELDKAEMTLPATTSSGTAEEVRPMLFGLGGWGASGSLKTGEPKVASVAALKQAKEPDAARVKVSADSDLKSTPASVADTVNPGTTPSPSPSSLVELARFGGRSAKRKTRALAPVKASMAQKVFDILGRDKRSFARVQGENTEAKSAQRGIASSPVVDALEQVTEEPSVEMSGEPESPRSGAALLFSLAAVSGVSGLWILRRRKQKQQAQA